jgi:hypothetical protein
MKKILFFAFQFIFIACHAQQPTKAPHDSLIRTVNDVSLALMDNYRPNEDSVASRCVEACVFIKFNISTRGKFVNIAYTKDTPVFIMNALTDAFKAISPKIAISKLGVVSKETYILPLQYTYNLACGFEHGSWDMPGDKQLTEKQKSDFKEKQMIFRQSASSIWNINNFTDGTYDVLRCVILPPMRTGGVMY